MGRTTPQKAKSRGIEHGVQIDIESDRALAVMGVEDPEEFRALLQGMGKGKRLWGPQGGNDGFSSPTRSENGNGNGNGTGREETPGIINGMDIRGMVPGGITGTRVSRVPEPMPADIPIHLNIP